MPAALGRTVRMAGPELLRPDRDHEGRARQEADLPDVLHARLLEDGRQAKKNAGAARDQADRHAHERIEARIGERRPEGMVRDLLLRLRFGLELGDDQGTPPRIEPMPLSRRIRQEPVSEDAHKRRRQPLRQEHPLPASQARDPVEEMHDGARKFGRR